MSTGYLPLLPAYYNRYRIPVHTPEGTRKANPNWKKGFYYIAQGAGLPIILVAIDYEKKCITAEKVIHPSGDLDKDMREVKLYYKNFKGKYPENFSIGKVE